MKSVFIASNPGENSAAYEEQPTETSLQERPFSGPSQAFSVWHTKQQRSMWSHGVYLGFDSVIYKNKIFASKELFTPFPPPEGTVEGRN
jgi:hypothetical protein